MMHWLQLVAIPNAPSSSSNQELQSLKKRIADLEKARSRSPRRNNQKQLAAAGGPQMLAFPAPSAPAQGQKGGKGRKRGGFGRYAAKSQATKNFDYLMKLPLEFRANFHEKFHKNEICYKFQKNSCTRSAAVVDSLAALAFDNAWRRACGLKRACRRAIHGVARVD